MAMRNKQGMNKGINKVVKPHNGLSALLVLIGIGNHVVEEATGFYGFWINGSLELVINDLPSSWWKLKLTTECHF